MYKLVVIKIGTSVITHHDGCLDLEQIENLTSQISILKSHGTDVIIVTSGAIGAGLAELGLKRRPKEVSFLQACAAVGQGKLIEAYAQVFKKKGHITAQILLTADDLRSRTRFLNAKNTLIKLLEKEIIPIVNENDTVAVEEIKFGDNDKLSALVTNLVHADLLVILSDIDGLYDREGKVMSRISHITKEIEDLCGKSGSALGTGGMKTKLEAAKIVTRAGEGMIIANGRKQDVLAKIFKGESIGTFFEPHLKGLNSKKRWLAFFTKPHGNIIIDKGAETALIQKGKSLLASGILDIYGGFKAGDVVNVIGTDGRKVACGLVNYNSDVLARIRGLKTSDIRKVLGNKIRDEVIHRNNMSLV